MDTRRSSILGSDGHPLVVSEPKQNGVVAPRSAGETEDFIRDVEAYLEEQGEIQGSAFKRAATSSKDAISEQIALQMLTASATQASDNPSDLLRFYKTSLWVYACVRATAETLAQVPLVATLREGTEKPVDMPDTDLQDLIDHPNEDLTSTDLILQWTTYLQIVGSGFVVGERQGQVIDDDSGAIESLRPLRPSRVGIVPGGTWVSWYTHNVNGRAVRIHPSNMAHVRHFNPEDDYWGLSPITVARRAANIEQVLEEFNKTFLENGGHPDTILEADADLGRIGRRRVERSYELKFEKGKSGGAFLLDRGIKVKPFGALPKDMEFVALSSHAEHRILAAYGVPPIIVMDLREASVLANAAVQVRMFYDVTMRPLGRKIAQCLTRLIRRDRRWESKRGRQWGVRFAFERVEQVLEDQIALRTQAAAEWNAGLIRRSEARSVGGWDKLDDDALNDEIKPSSPGSFGLPLGLSMGPHNEPRVHIAVTATEEYKRLAMSQVKTMRRRWEPAMQDALTKAFRSQKRRVLRRFREQFNIKAAKASDHDFVDEQLLSSLFPLTEEDQAIFDALGPIYLDAMVDSGTGKLASLFPRSGLLFDQNLESVRRALDAFGAKQIVRINEATRDAIRRQLVVAFQDGISNVQLENELKDLFRTYEVGPANASETVQTRVERIVQTEVGQALNVGGWEAARVAEEAGAVLQKQWLSVRDGNVRASHAALDASTSANPIPLGQPFDNGLMHPQDSDGPASELVNCRCALVEVVKKEPIR